MSERKRTSKNEKHRPMAVSTFIALGFAIILVGLGGFGVWAATAPLASAVVAPGTVMVEGKRKSVQHLEGGIVSKIMVSEGDIVKKGQPLVRLDDTQQLARMEMIRAQLDSALGQQARLLAERDGASEIWFPDELVRRADKPGVVEVMDAQIRQFKERRHTLDGKVAIYRQRIEQFREQIVGLTSARDSGKEQVRIYKDELVGLRELYEKGYYPRTRILSIEREIARLEGEVGTNQANIAGSQNGIGQAELEILQLEKEFRESIVRELSDVEDSIRDLRERLVIAEDALTRAQVLAPADGMVQEVKVHTIGGVVRPGEEMMQIVPLQDRLLVEAEVSVTDVDSVSIGQKAEVRFPAFKLRTTPTVLGEVVTVSADRIDEPQRNRSFFLARVEVPESEIAKLGDNKLRAGMPAQVLISTGERTVLNFLVKPLMDAMARAFKEE